MVPLNKTILYTSTCNMETHVHIHVYTCTYELCVSVLTSSGAVEVGQYSE